MRGATDAGNSLTATEIISTHTPHAGRDTITFNNKPNYTISTHTPHAGRDDWQHVEILTFWIFQLTRPMRGATKRRRNHGRRDRISTHTPHAGRDYVGGVNYELFTTFQLTRPMRGATDWCGHCVSRLEFQLTRPMRGATPPRKRDGKSRRISTHTPHAGRDEAYA